MRNAFKIVFAIGIVALFLIASGEALARPRIHGGGGGGTSYTNFYGDVTGIIPIDGSAYFQYSALAGASVTATYRARYGLQLPIWVTDTVTTNSKGHFELSLSYQNKPGWEVFWPVTLKAFKHPNNAGPWFWTERWSSDKYLPHNFLIPQDKKTYVYDALQFTQTDSAYIAYDSGYKFNVKVQAYTTIDPLWGWSMTKDLSWIADLQYISQQGSFGGPWAGSSPQVRTWFWSTGQFYINGDGDAVIEGAAIYGNPITTEVGYDWEMDYLAPSSFSSSYDFFIPGGESSTIPEYLSTAEVQLPTGICANVICDRGMFNLYPGSVPLSVKIKGAQLNTYKLSITFWGGTNGHWFRHVSESLIIHHVFCTDFDHQHGYDDPLYAVGGHSSCLLPILPDWRDPAQGLFDPPHRIYAGYSTAGNSLELWAYSNMGSVPSWSKAEVWAEYTVGVPGTYYAYIPGEFKGTMMANFGNPEITLTIRVIEISYSAIVSEKTIYNWDWEYWGFTKKIKPFGSSFDEIIAWNGEAGKTYRIELSAKANTAAFGIFVASGYCAIDDFHANFYYMDVWRGT